MTGSSGGRPDQHRKRGLWTRQSSALDAERGLGEWTLGFWSRECDAARWFLVAGSWDCNWKRSNSPWGSVYELVHVSRQNTVARLHVGKYIWPNETSRGSSESWSQHLTPCKQISCGWYDPARHSFYASFWIVSNVQHLFPRLPFASSQVPFTEHWLWPSPSCRLARARKHLYRCEYYVRRLACNTMSHHHEVYIEHTYRILTMPVWTQLQDWIWDTKRGFRLVEPGLQLQSAPGSFPSSPSHSIEKLPHMIYLLVWGHGKQAQITRLHCTCPGIHAFSWSG